MGRVVVQATMSLDGFIADPSGGVGPLFDWYFNGEVEFRDNERTYRVSAASAEYLRSAWRDVGPGVVGRRLFDITDGWGGVPPVGDAAFVVTHRVPTAWVDTHPDAPFTFVTDGVESAIARAQAVAGERVVSLTAGDLTGQALAAGLVDELRIDLVPVLLGAGVRYFGDFTGAAQLLENPEAVQGDRVTHLHYRIRRETP
ncbi:MAG TPA: dihydrofolate reductase family protein [Pseudonocardia sp.]|jgi:dihydrofolate reductase|uniref:dihydrofolate reductase family protein n=1 Tax=Pseudonocardia sp. TaxID=60912 RepID=UPI002B4B39B7|nr:dihydrofolate reductase family protein [Pseudonocardia sp.]HLU54178.1 dihydrofolate reductase family protein [Pseudonocardia sp.]